MSFKKLKFSFGLFGLILLSLAIATVGAQAKTNLKVFHAGSLSVPFKKIESKFESKYPEVDVQLEAHGSVVAVRQVTDVGKRGDIVAVADYSLIPSMMIPDYADFYIQFARNRMVLAYSSGSDFSEKINSDNWYNVLDEPEVQFGFSNPNMDPCGYRSLMVTKLAEKHYLDTSIFNKLIIDNSAISVKKKDDKYEIMVPEVLRPDTENITIRNKEVDLVAMLQQGGLDYAFEYMGVAKQHDLEFVKLPPAIDLSSTSYSETYAKVEVRTADGKLKKAKPIVYGITIPENAPHPEAAKKFIKFLTGSRGNQIFRNLGQPPIVPARGYREVPEGLNDLVS